ncbi:hypothetical protein [Nostoc sp. C057]|nr:hypothetical protein [Nostoc sp. C057]
MKNNIVSDAMVQQLFTQGSLFDLQTVIDYGQSVINVAQELAKVLT